MSSKTTPYILEKEWNNGFLKNIGIYICDIFPLNLDIFLEKEYL